jgi:hypothetical protein
MYHDVLLSQKGEQKKSNQSLALRLLKSQSLNREFKVTEKKL